MYQNHEKLPNIGQDGQRKLLKSTVTILGIGSVGSKVAELMVRAGVGLRLVDRDRVYEQDLIKQGVFVQDHVSKFKAKEAKKELERINAAVKVRTFHEDLSKQNIFLIDGADMVIDCSNNLDIASLLAAHCKKAKVPLITCFYSGEKAFIFHQSAKTYVDAVRSKLEKELAKDDGALGATTSICASIVTTEAFKVLLAKQPTQGLITVNAWTPSIKISR
ncbi:MAG: ThiF family adenylyltransferase [Nanoarchaeota archaeon]